MVGGLYTYPLIRIPVIKGGMSEHISPTKFNWVVVSNIFYFYPVFLGRWSNFTTFFSNLSIHFPKNTLTLAPWRTLKYKMIFWVNWLWRLSTYTYFWRGGMLGGGRLTSHKLGTLLIHFAMLIIPSCWVFSFFSFGEWTTECRFGLPGLLPGNMSGLAQGWFQDMGVDEQLATIGHKW